RALLSLVSASGAPDVVAAPPQRVVVRTWAAAEDARGGQWRSVERNTVPLRARRRSVVPAALLALVLGLSGCSQTADQPDQEAAVEQGHARPAESPQAAGPAEGATVDTPATVRTLLASGEQVTAQVDDPSRLEIGTVEGTRWSSERTVELPAAAGDASVALDGTVLVPHSDGVVVVPPSGPERDLTGLGPVTTAAMTPDGRILTGTADGAELYRLSGLESVDRIAVARDGSVTALSRPDTVLASIDLDEEQAGPLLRAGKGAGMLSTFSSGSVVASDTVGDTLLVYSTSP